MNQFPGLFPYIFVFVCGAILGSFLNSWMWRTRENIRILALSRSVCIYCHRQLAWYENIPLVSFFMLRRSCRTCGRSIPQQYFIVELITALLLTLIFYIQMHYGVFDVWRWWRDIFFLSLLIIIFFYDYNYGVILSRVIWLGAVIGGLINYFALDMLPGSMICAAVLVGGFFWLQYALSRGRWIGGGDVRFGVLMGMWLGWPQVLVAIGVAYLLGAVAAIILLIKKQASMHSALSFGTFLSVGTLVSLYAADSIIDWYTSLF